MSANSCLLCGDREGRGGRREPWSPLCGSCVVSFSGREVLPGAELDEGALTGKSEVQYRQAVRMVFTGRLVRKMNS